MIESHWDFQRPQALGLAVACIIILLTLVFSAINWKRGHLGKKDGFLALLRIVILAMIGLTLARPEWVTTRRIEEEPGLVVVVDDTGSMSTADVPEGEAILTRNDWVNKRMESEFWKPLEGTFKVSVERLSELVEYDEDEELGTNLDEGLRVAKRRHDNTRAMIVLSDGDWNQGESPVSAATELRFDHVHVYPMAVGSDSYLPDLELSNVKAPAFSILGESVLMTFRLKSHMKRDLRTVVKLKSSFGVEASKEVFIPAGHMINEQILWSANRSGEFDLTLEVPVEREERIKTNNSRAFKVSVKQEILKVLLVDSLPRWEYRYLRNALMRDPGVAVNTLLLHPDMKRGGGRGYIKAFPDGKDKISEYDVIFIGDVGVGKGELTQENLKMIKGVVEKQGSGLVFLPGIRGRQLTFGKTVLNDLLPVELDPANPKGSAFRTPSRLKLTRSGSDHLLTLLTSSPAGNYMLWKNLPGFYWSAPVLRAKPGSDVLAVHSSQRNQWGRIPLLVTQKQGNGTVLFLGTDNAWRWRRGVEDRFHYRFWGQVVRWMAHPRHMSHKKGVRLFYSPENPEQGNQVNFQATVFDENGFPLTEGTVTADLITPDNRQQRLTLDPVDGGWGVFTGKFKAKTAGKYKLTIRAPELGHVLHTIIIASRKTVEKVGVPARYGALKDIAKTTKGQFFMTGKMDDMIAEIQALPKEDLLTSRSPLWSRWWWGLCILGMMCVYWVLRKLWGLI